MFENLGNRFQNVLDKIKGYGKITEENIKLITTSFLSILHYLLMLQALLLLMDV